MASTKAQQEELAKLFAKYHSKLSYLYTSYTKRIIKTIPIGEKAEDYWIDNPLFNFDLFPELRERLNQIFIEYFNDNMLCYKQGISDGVALAYSQDDVNLGKYTILQDKAIDTARKATQTAFYERRVQRQGGLSLSDRVWNYAQMGKSEIETAIANVIGDGITKGTSAEELGRSVRQYLNNPDMMYRRYHKLIVGNAGHKRRVVRWYRRHIDENGNVTFKDEPLEKVGTGTYRSSRMNSLRLMRTEINMAYHNANSERWQREPFVIGIRIWLSPEHPEYDICDELMGEYPKNFVFSGWHPACLCASAPITIQGDEKKEFYRRLMDGEDMSNYVSPNAVKTPPAAWNKYIKDQHDNILAAGERGKLAYHLRDNTKYWLGSFSANEQKLMGFEIKKTIKEIADERHAKRTIDKENMLREYWQNKVNAGRAVRTADKLRALTQNNGKFYNILDEDTVWMYWRIKDWQSKVMNNPTQTNITQLVKSNKLLGEFFAKKQRVINKTVANVISTAEKLGYVDIKIPLSELKYIHLNQDIILSDRYARAKYLAKYIANINKESRVLSDLIPNANSLLAEYSISEIKVAYSEIQDVMNRWISKYGYSSIDDAPLQHLKNKLDFELSSPTIRYTNKTIINKALKEKITLIDKKIEWDELVSRTASLMQYKTQSVKYKKYLAAIDDAIQKNDFAALKQGIADAENMQQQLIARQLRKGGSTALNTEYKGSATGKDISASIDVRNMVSEDPYRGTFANNVARMQGFDSPAKLVSESEFDILSKDCGDIFFRTVNPAVFKGKNMSSKEFASQLYKADLLELNGPGGRVYGDGMYVASSAWDGSDLNKLTSSLINNSRQNSLAYGHGNHTLSEMTWLRKPRIIKQTDLEKLWDKLTDEEQERFGDYNNRNTYAIALGYDAMYCDGPNYIVVWNRSIVAVKKQ